MGSSANGVVSQWGQVRVVSQWGQVRIIDRSQAYDAASRLAFVTNGALTAGYSYVANSPLVQDIILRHNGTARMAVSKAYDSLNRLTRSAAQASGGSLFSFDYLYNAANQRGRVTLEDGSQWDLSYDFLGQLDRGHRLWSDGAFQFVEGHQFQYAYDGIGNRLWTKSGGTASGNTNSLRQNFYTPNSLNQYVQRTVTNFNGTLRAAQPQSLRLPTGRREPADHLHAPACRTGKQCPIVTTTWATR